MKKIILIIILILLPTTVLAAFDIDFTSQAPVGDWRQPWQDACEETSVVMVDAFYGGYDLTVDKSVTKIKTVFAIKEKFFGPSYDETAGLIVDMINRHFPWESRVVENPTLDQIKFELDASRPVLVPVHGGTLNNPNYHSGSIDYHMIVLIGYDDARGEFMAHDPGTQFGSRHHYSYDTIMAAMHDFLPNDQTLRGAKVAIFTQPDISLSGQTDGDRDGLLKIDEIRSGANLSQADTDRDGFLDGEEVQQGYSPLVAEFKLGDNRLVRDAATQRIYFISGSQKRHIQTLPTVFSYGRLYGAVVNVSAKFLNSFVDGQPIH
ncbi:TPA: hypothetical protein DF272_01480 [Candidatus Falkowbacteria bacterium]|nr:hypothetical protein [Candidatus Falkowbacteria bacterium]HLD34700.1 C39 family peptidase [Patescibacteria group bacterium]